MEKGKQISAKMKMNYGNYLEFDDVLTSKMENCWLIDLVTAYQPFENILDFKNKLFCVWM